MINPSAAWCTARTHDHRSSAPWHRVVVCWRELRESSRKTSFSAASARKVTLSSASQLGGAPSRTALHLSTSPRLNRVCLHSAAHQRTAGCDQSSVQRASQCQCTAERVCFSRAVSLRLWVFFYLRSSLSSELDCDRVDYFNQFVS